MTLLREIVVRFQWEGTHCWPEAEGRHEYLKHEHRHLFKGRAWIEVNHNDRELEYFAVLDRINHFIEPFSRLGNWSCEHVACEILDALLEEYGSKRHVRVEVTEDGENGSVVTWSP